MNTYYVFQSQSSPDLRGFTDVASGSTFLRRQPFQPRLQGDKSLHEVVRGDPATVVAVPLNPTFSLRPVCMNCLIQWAVVSAERGCR
jgi:hypothetical protein